MHRVELGRQDGAGWIRWSWMDKRDMDGQDTDG